MLLPNTKFTVFSVLRPTNIALLGFLVFPYSLVYKLPELSIYVKMVGLTVLSVFNMGILHTKPSP